MENISTSFMEYIQTTDNLNVDMLFDFLPVYFDQPRIPPFPIGFVKIESESLNQLRLIKQDERWWQLWLELMFILFLFSQTWPVTLKL